MSKNARPRRSVLYMPGSNARALEKGRTLAADGLILDLEDAVAPDAKEEARDRIRAGAFHRRHIAAVLVLVDDHAARAAVERDGVRRSPSGG